MHQCEIPETRKMEDNEKEGVEEYELRLRENLVSDDAGPSKLT